MALIAGPTASGKSSLAIELAARTGGIIVNADSAQLYRDLPLLSAAPSAADRARADHRMYGIRDGADPCSAAEWAALARDEIDAIHAAERLPILVGGTGLYLRTLIDGIAPIPPIDPAIRAEIRAAPVAANFAALGELDAPMAARLGRGDTTRVARALEVVMATGRSIAAWRSERRGGIGDRVRLHPLILLPPRPWLYARCDARFGAMLAGGAIDEVAGLLRRRLDPDLPVMRAIGVSEIAALIGGEASREATLVAGAQATRRYAKRQYTWFANQPPAAWPRSQDPSADEAVSHFAALLATASNRS